MTISTTTWEDANLTATQIAVLRRLLDAKPPKKIAQELGITENTARTHIRDMRIATGTHSILELALWGTKARNWS